MPIISSPLMKTILSWCQDKNIKVTLEVDANKYVTEDDFNKIIKEPEPKKEVKAESKPEPKEELPKEPGPTEETPNEPEEPPKKRRGRPPRNEQ